MYHVMVVEDQQLVRETIVHALSQNDELQVVVSIGDANQALRYCKQTRIDIILMDICTENNASGLKAAAAIKRMFPEIKVIMMTGLPTITFIDEAREAGVDGFVYKDISISDLIHTMLSSMRGYSSFPLSQPTPFCEVYKSFTDQEKVILKLICEGLTRKEISERLNITENTVKSHFSHMISKSGQPSISKLAIYVMTNNYIHPNL